MDKQLPALISEKKIEIHFRSPYSYSAIKDVYGPAYYLFTVLFPELVDWDQVASMFESKYREEKLNE